MSIQEQEAPVVVAPRHQYGEVLGLAFADAAAVSYGAYDTPEQRTERVEVARRLESAMEPGVSLVHQVNELDVRGGVLLESPRIVNAPHGDGHELAIAYLLWRGGEEQQGIMRFRSLVKGVEYGTASPAPLLAVGREGIKTMVRHEFVEQLDREQQPGGLHWSDISPITQLRMFGALTETDVRLSDVVAEPLVMRVQDDIIDGLRDPQQRHMHGDLVRGLFGTAHISPAFAHILMDYYLKDVAPGHRAKITGYITAHTQHIT